MFSYYYVKALFLWHKMRWFNNMLGTLDGPVRLRLDQQLWTGSDDSTFKLS